MNTYKIIIPVHNPKPEFVDFLTQLGVSNPSSLENTVVVDDGSTNDTIKNIHAVFSDMTILRGDGNLWWGGGIRLGMQHALDSGVNVVVWLNSDCLPDVGSIDKLVELSLRPNIGAVGGWCYTKGAEKWGFNPGFIKLRPIPVRDLESNDLMDVHGLNGNFVAVNMEAVKSVGLPRTDLFPHYMDGPYTHLIHKKGFRLEVATKIRASLSRDLERSVGVFDYCSVWQSGYMKKLEYFFFSRRSTHHLKDKFHRVRAVRGSILFMPVYLLSLIKVFFEVTAGHIFSMVFSPEKIVEKVTLKYEGVTPSDLLRDALAQLSQRRT